MIRDPMLRWLPRATALALLGLAACAPMNQPAPMPGVALVAEAPPVGTLTTPGNVRAVLTEANLLEIRPSELALERTDDPQIRAFARAMVTDHSHLQRRLEALMADRRVPPEHNALSLQLRRNLKPTLTSLRQEHGEDFDTSYVLQQIASHQMTLHTLDTTLIPATRDPALRAYLVDEVRPVIARHLDRALQIHERMRPQV